MIGDDEEYAQPGRSSLPAEFLADSSSPDPFSSTVISGLDFSTPASFSPHLETSVDLGPYGVFWLSQSSGPASVGQFLTFSAQDGSQKNLEYVSLSPIGIEPWNTGSDSASVNLCSPLANEVPTTTAPHFGFTSDQVLSISSDIDSSQVLSLGGSGLGAAYSNLSSITTLDHTEPTSKLDQTSGFQCSTCGKLFPRPSELR
jgi:hypothetical protein